MAVNVRGPWQLATLDWSLLLLAIWSHLTVG